MSKDNDWLAGRTALHVLGRAGGTGPADAVLAHTSGEVLSARSAGYLPENIFYRAPFDDSAGRVAADCRFVAAGLEDLRFLDRTAGHTGAEGILRAGLRLRMPGLPRLGDAVLPDELSLYASELRSLRHLTVRGCFFSADLADAHGRELGRFFRAGYEAAKRMTVTLPCAMPFLCFENAIAAVGENRERHPETLDDCLRALDIMTMQNETAFYAKLYLS